MRKFQTRLKVGFALVAGLATCAGMMAANDAEAAYSGNITRSVCMAGAMVPRQGDQSFWDSPEACSARVLHAAAPFTAHWARVSIPVERKTTTATITPTVSVSGGGSGNGMVCARFWVSDPFNNLSASGQDCTAAPYGLETLTPSPLTLPIDGAATIDIAAQHTGTVHVVGLRWTANGL